MNPLVALAATVFPDILKLIARDVTGTLISKVQGAVADTTGTSSAPDARQKIEQDPALASDLQAKLADIALQAHQADLAAATKSDDADLAFNQMQATNTVNARATLQDLIKLSNPIAYTPSIISYIVVVGFFAALLLLMSGKVLTGTASTGPLQIVNILIGALSAAFATVINFWLGSSLGSRKKDAATTQANTLDQLKTLSTPPAAPAPAPVAPPPSQPPPASAPVGTQPGAASGSSPATVPIVTGLSAAAVAAAQASQRKWNIPASITLAQFGIESSWGKHMPVGSNNPFGIKAVAGQPFVTARTREIVGGRSVMMNQNFAQYPSLAEAFDAHGKLLAQGRPYVNARSKLPDADAFAQALTGVYAGDPTYGTVLVNIMKSQNLYQFNALPA